MIKVGSIRDAYKFANSIAIVRSMRTYLPRVVQMQDLSPSQEIFYDYLKAKDAGRWNEEYFQQHYVPSFIKQMATDEGAKTALQLMVERSKEKDIFMCCYCLNENLCHRSIVGGILFGMGADISVSADWIKYYHMLEKEASWLK